MESKWSKESALRPYRTLVTINLAITLIILLFRQFFLVVISQILNGETAGVSGPEAFAVLMFCTFITIPATIIIQIVPAIITIFQSARLVKHKTITMNNPWFIMAIIGVMIELFTLALTL